MTAINYFQLGGELGRPPYSGCDSTESFYGGQHTTVALPASPLVTDTVEIPLCELPPGLRVNAIKWAIGGNLGTNTSAKIVMRKKSNVINPATTIAGSGGGASSGIATGTPDVTVQINGADSAVTTTSANNATNVIIPTQFEGLTPAKNTLQEAYYLCLKVTFGATPTWVTGVPVFVGVEGEFVGTL
ncbi:MAG: hypothetical protein ACXV8O_01335 [Methylobacter sp.]